MSNRAATDFRGKFLFVGDHVALDFVNTRLREASMWVELCSTSEDVLLWLKHAELIQPTEFQTLRNELVQLKCGERLLETVVNLRSEWQAVLAGLIELRPLPPGFIARLNELMAPALSRQMLVSDMGNQPYRLVHQRLALPADAKVLALLAGCIADFITAMEQPYLRKCAADDCVVYFYDRTKSHRRQWCSMAICGNRHKVAKFRARQETRKK